MKRAIVNIATRPGDQRGQHRLRKSIQQYAPEVDFYGFTNELQVGAPLHAEAPYAFKTFAIDMIRKRGYDKVMWLDAAVWAIKDISAVWDYLDDEPVLFQPTGHTVGTWTNDKCLAHFGKNRDEVMDMPMVWAGFQGINFNDPFARMYFDMYHRYGKAGDLFRGAWNNNTQSESADPRCRGHRHDQSVASLIVDKLGIKITDKEFAVYVGGDYGHRQDGNICFWSQGHE